MVGTAITLLVALLLMYAAFSDLRRLTIPNWISLAFVAVFALSMATLTFDEVLARLSIAFVVFGIGVVLFAFNVLGAGDVKLLSTLLLLLPSYQTVGFFLVLSITLLLGVTIVSLVRLLPAARASNFRSFATPGAFPMGISISSAGLICLLAPMALA